MLCADSKSADGRDAAKKRRALSRRVIAERLRPKSSFAPPRPSTPSPSPAAAHQSQNNRLRRGWTGHVRQAHGSVPADPKDDMVVAAALEANASYIVSEDKHLLDLGDYEGIKIMNRKQFGAELDRLGVPEVGE